MPVLQKEGDIIESTAEQISPEDVQDVDWLISYGYRYILKLPLLERLPNRAINLHISYLPWNRGADPNFWSHFDGTPSGVTIHLMDAGIDTGDILAQREINFVSDDTLQSSYWRLRRAIEDLFAQNWPAIRRGQIKPIPQSEGGSYHRLADKVPWMDRLTKGWDTPISEVRLLGFTARIP